MSNTRNLSNATRKEPDGLIWTPRANPPGHDGLSPREITALPTMSLQRLRVLQRCVQTLRRSTSIRRPKIDKPVWLVLVVTSLCALFLTSMYVTLLVFNPHSLPKFAQPPSVSQPEKTDNKPRPAAPSKQPVVVPALPASPRQESTPSDTPSSTPSPTSTTTSPKPSASDEPTVSPSEPSAPADITPTPSVSDIPSSPPTTEPEAPPSAPVTDAPTGAPDEAATEDTAVTP